MATKKQSVVEFGDFTAEDADAAKLESDASQGGMFLKIKEGKTTIRVVPPPKGQKLFRVAYVHFIDVPGVGRTSFNCPRIMDKRKCKTCMMEQQLAGTGKPIDYKKSKQLKAKRQVYVNAIVRGEEEQGMRIWRFGKMIEDQLVEIRQDAEEGGNFAHPIEGFDIRVSRKGSGALDTEYKVTAAQKRPTKLAEVSLAELQEMIDNQPNLARMLEVLDDEAIDRKLNGEEEDDDRPRGRGKGAKPQRTIEDDTDAASADDGEFTIED
jgi:hypothetical protein